MQFGVRKIGWKGLTPLPPQGRSVAVRCAYPVGEAPRSAEHCSAAHWRVMREKDGSSPAVRNPFFSLIRQPPPVIRRLPLVASRLFGLQNLPQAAFADGKSPRWGKDNAGENRSGLR